MNNDHQWLESIDFIETVPAPEEPGIFRNKIVFTHKNGAKLCLVLFDTAALDADTLGEEYYAAAKETLNGLPAGFPEVNSIMYSKAARDISKRGKDEFLY